MSAVFLHIETLLSVFQLVAALLAFVTLGSAWQMRGDRGMWLWAGAFGTAALTQFLRPWLRALDAPVALTSVGHVGGVVAALLVLLALRALLGLPMRPRWPLAWALLLCAASLLLTGVFGKLGPSLAVTQGGCALLFAPAAWAASRAWREQRSFALGLMAATLWFAAVMSLGRGLSVAPWVVHDRLQAVQNNGLWLLVTIGQLIVQAFALQLLVHEHALRQIHRLIEIDVLTGLLNRRGFEERLRRLLQRSEGQPPVLAVLDVDHFKRINDSHGHSVGDAVLSGIGERLRAVLRPGDMAVRLGGEEFAVIWPQAEPGGELHLAERLREAIGSQHFLTSAGPLLVTASVGVAVARGADEAPETLFSRADAALYEAKRAGRDRVLPAG